jgi:hypothetical protein
MTGACARRAAGLGTTARSGIYWRGAGLRLRPSRYSSNCDSRSISAGCLLASVDTRQGPVAVRVQATQPARIHELGKICHHHSPLLPVDQGGGATALPMPGPRRLRAYLAVHSTAIGGRLPPWLARPQRRRPSLLTASKPALQAIKRTSLTPKVSIGPDPAPHHPAGRGLPTTREDSV